MGEGGSLLRRTLRRLYVSIELLDSSLCQAALEQLETAGNARQQIVEVVREASCQLTHGPAWIRTTVARTPGDF
jgi:hypothetical protein